MPSRLEPAARQASPAALRLRVSGHRNERIVTVLKCRGRAGREIALPAHAESVRGWDRQIAALKGTYAVSTIAPQEGDGVLMRAAARRRSIAS